MKKFIRFVLICFTILFFSSTVSDPRYCRFISFVCLPFLPHPLRSHHGLNISIALVPPEWQIEGHCYILAPSSMVKGRPEKRTMWCHSFRQNRQRQRVKIVTQEKERRSFFIRNAFAHHFDRSFWKNEKVK